jgi:hypothetical protein
MGSGMLWQPKLTGKNADYPRPGSTSKPRNCLKKGAGIARSGIAGVGYGAIAALRHPPLKSLRAIRAFTDVVPESLPKNSEMAIGFVTPGNATGEPAASKANLLPPRETIPSTRFAPFTVP